MKRTAILIAIVTVVAGCGGSSAEDQIRATETKAVEALTSDHPERSCQYSTDHDGCIDAIVKVKALGMDTQAVAGIPDDWRDRVKQAKITVTGDKATLAPGPTGKTAHFVLMHGSWRAVPQT